MNIFNQNECIIRWVIFYDVFYGIQKISCIMIQYKCIFFCYYLCEVVVVLGIDEVVIGFGYNDWGINGAVGDYIIYNKTNNKTNNQTKIKN